MEQKEKTLIITRKGPDFEALDPQPQAKWPYGANYERSADAESIERFIPSRFLEGPLPTVLVAGYNFYFEEPEFASPDGKVMIRGYPIVEDESSRHVMLVCVEEVQLKSFCGQQRRAATIHKHYCDGFEQDRYLINLFCGSKDIDSLLHVLTRLDTLSHIMVWSYCERSGPRPTDTYEVSTPLWI